MVFPLNPVSPQPRSSHIIRTMLGEDTDDGLAGEGCRKERKIKSNGSKLLIRVGFVMQ